jgi:hypothetical protein
MEKFLYCPIVIWTIEEGSEVNYINSVRIHKSTWNTHVFLLLRNYPNICIVLQKNQTGLEMDSLGHEK